MFITNKKELDKLVVLGQSEETYHLEFKKELNYLKPKIEEEIALDITQFLNSMGGVIIFGIEELLNPQLGKKVATNYVNVEFEKLSKFINDRVVPIVHPKQISLELFSISINPTTTIVAVNIKPLAISLACVHQKQAPFAAKFPYRSHYGKKYFSPQEVEKIMSKSNRYVPIKLNELSQEAKEITLYPDVIKEKAEDGLSWDISDCTTVLKGVGASEYSLNVAGIDINIPFSLTRDVWLTEKNTIGVLLEIKLVISANRKNIHFDLKQ